MDERARILAALEQLEPDAIAVLALIADRLLAGQRAYGRLDIDNDGRDWRREALDEVADAAVYAAIGLIRERRRGLEARRKMAPVEAD